jgi:MFS family permease
MAGAFGSLDTMLNIAFPDLVDAFGIETADLVWVVVTFVLSYGIALLAAGRLADRLGHRQVLRWGAWASAAVMVACAVAPTYGVLLVARVGQGVATASVMAAAPALVTTAAEPGWRGRALGVFQMAAAFGLAMGPVIGGPVVAAVGWRGVFWVRVPLAIGLAVFAARPLGHERRAGLAPPRLDLGALRHRSLVIANLLSLAANFAMFAIWLLVPTLLVDELGYSELTGGVVLGLSPLMTALAAPVAGRLTDRLGPGPVAAAGLFVEAAGLALASRVTADTSLGIVCVAIGLVGAGVGLFSVANMTQVMGALGDEQQGVAGAVALVTRTVGITAGVVVASAVFRAQEAAAGFFPAFQRTLVVMAVVALGAAVVATATRPPGPARPRRTVRVADPQ